MKFFLFLSIGLTGFFSQIAFGRDLHALSRENDYLITSFDIQEYADRTKETIYKAIEEITAVSPDLQTFANTLRPWNRLIVELSRRFSLLKSIEQVHVSCSVEAFRALQELQAIFSKETEEQYNLYTILTHAAEQAIKGLEPLERYIAGSFLANYQKNFLHLRGSSTEKKSKGFTILHFQEKDFPSKELSAVSQKIAAEDADIVCIQTWLNEEEVHTLYQLLQDDYAHFYLYVTPSTLHFPKEGSSVLLISKYPLEKLHFNQFTEEESGFFDFVVKSKTEEIGHVYTAQLPPGKCEDIRSIRLGQIIEKMEVDFQEESVPFILCGDLSIVRGSREAAEILLEGSFYRAKEQLDTHYVLYFPPVLGFFQQSDWEISTSIVPIVDNYSGFLTTVKNKWQNSIGVSFTEKKSLGEAQIFLCKNSAGGSVSRDKEGNTTGEVHTKVEGEDGKVRGGVELEVTRDRDGNMTTKGTLSVDVEF